MTLKLEELPIELDGRTYLCRCNMAVIETVQEAHGGDFGEVMNMSVRDSALEFLAAMLNDYAEDQGWPDIWTAAKLKRRVTLAMLTEIFGLVSRSLTPPQAAAEAGTGDAGN